MLHRSLSPILFALLAFDCFLSHNSQDKPAVRELAQILSARGCSVWLDEEQLRPGIPWQQQLESGIIALGSVAVLVGADGLGPWEKEEQEAALILAVDEHRLVIPVLLPTAPKKPRLPLFLRTRTWVDLRPSAAHEGPDGIERLIWGITGKKPGAVKDTIGSGKRRDSKPKPRPRKKSVTRPKPSALVHQNAIAAITESLDRIHALYAALVKQPVANNATTPAEVAARLCAAHGDFLAALRALEAALPEAARQIVQRGEDLSAFRRYALDALGWMVVTTVLDGYDREDAKLIQAWIQGGVFHSPLGRSPCVEVLTACWREGKAEFSTEPARFDYGPDDITPARFGRIGFEDPMRLDPERAVGYVWRRVYQDVYGNQAPPKLPPAKLRDLRTWLDHEREQGRRLRLVIDRYDLDEAFACTPRAIA